MSTRKRRNDVDARDRRRSDDDFARDGCDADFSRDDFDVSTLGELRSRRFDVSSAPDLTRPIMGRLGYMRASARAARRRRIAMWTGRCACLAIAGIALVLGVKAFERSPDARRPADLTMPAAISRDLQQQQDRLGSVIRLIRQSPLGLDAAGWDAGHVESPDDEPLEPLDSHEIDEELNRSAIAPVRWV